MEHFDGSKLIEFPTSESARLLDFENAKVRPGIVSGTYVLIVSGEKPYLNMTVRLIPRIYVKQPVYWAIEVVGYLSGVGLPAFGSYTETLPLDGVIGTKGIEVVGATRSEQIDIP